MTKGHLALSVRKRIFGGFAVVLLLLMVLRFTQVNTHLLTVITDMERV